MRQQYLFEFRLAMFKNKFQSMISLQPRHSNLRGFSSKVNYSTDMQQPIKRVCPIDYEKYSNRNSYCGVTFNRKTNLYENEIIKVYVEFVRRNRLPKAHLNFLPSFLKIYTLSKQIALVSGKVQEGNFLTRKHQVLYIRHFRAFLLVLLWELKPT